MSSIKVDQVVKAPAKPRANKSCQWPFELKVKPIKKDPTTLTMKVPYGRLENFRR